MNNLTKISKQKIESYLGLPSEIIFFEETESTNDYAKKIIREAPDDGTIIIAAAQTKGRGQYGRAFHSPESGIYLTIIRKNFNSELVTIFVAVKTAEAIEELTGLKISVKWVNDLILNSKKVGGILTESTFFGEDKYTIIGVGINFTEPIGGFPHDIKDIAGALFKDEPTVCISKLTAAIANKIITESINEDIIFKYKTKLYNLNEAVYYNEEKVIVNDVSPKGELVLLKENAEKIILTSPSMFLTKNFSKKLCNQ